MVIQEHPDDIPRYFKWAARLAEKSDHPLHKMGAVLVRNGNLAGSGYNKNHSHPRSESYENMIHAELSALLNAGKIWGNTRKTDLYVVRVTKGGSLATSKPCDDCMDLMLETGIDSVTYIDENGRVKKEEL